MCKKQFKTVIIALALILFLTSTPTVYASSESQTERYEITIPQKVYSVSKSIKSFKLNAESNGPLTYESSNPKVASVSAKGVVRVKKNGKAYIRIKADETSKKVTVKVSSYKAANGYFVEAMGDIDKRSGDSTGREIRAKHYRGYNGSDHARNWGFIIRCNDPAVADKAALAVKYIAKNDHFGFKSHDPTSQKSVYARAEVYKTIVNVTGKNPTKKKLRKILSIKKKANTSCTATCLVGYWLYYDMSDKLSMKWISPYNKKEYKYYCGGVNIEYHQLEKAIRHINSEYRKKGMLEPFTIIYIPASKRSSYFSKANIKKNLKRGDLICSCPNYKKGGHTGIIL